METNYNSNPVKTDKELVRFHKQLITKYLNNETEADLKEKKLILAYYDHRINEDNIRYYFNCKLKIFLTALLTERLETIKNYAKDISAIKS